MPATVISIDVVVGQIVAAGQGLVVLESMKMEHVVVATSSGIVSTIAVSLGDTIAADALLVQLGDTDAIAQTVLSDTKAVDGAKAVRADLAQVIERHEIGLDAARPDAVAKRVAKGQRTARENILDLLDAGTFIEYAPLVTAAQRRRRTADELRSQTPADGLVGGVGTVNGRRVVAISYDYMVLAGTQGLWNHFKKDRLFELAERAELPVVLFAEGGGGRPGDTDGMGVSGLDCLAFNYFARLSGVVPLVGIVSGYCFAGNAALLGCCDVVIATENSNIGLGGPAMIEGGGLGTFEPKEIGPAPVQVASGVIDVLVADEADAVAVAKKYLEFFGKSTTEFSCVDQLELRDVIPESRTRAYDVHAVVDRLFDANSVLELRAGFAQGMVTAIARVEGNAIGVVANNPMHLGGAIDSDGADKAARFMQLCDAFGLPLIFLCDTPGFMVGPDSEASGAVRHMSRLFVTGANLNVPAH